MEISYFDAKGLRSLGLIAESAPVQGTEWPRPAEASVDQRADGSAYVTWSGHAGMARAGAADDTLLTEFMALSGASAKPVAGFVKKWGPLNLCMHGLPVTHRPRRMWGEFAELDAAPCEVELARPRGDIGESVERWHYFASHASALHDAAKRLLSGHRLTYDLWSKLVSILPGRTPNERLELDEGYWRRNSTPEDDQRIVASGLQQWLNYGDVGIHVIWRSGRASLRYGGRGLAGALGLQLAMTCTTTGSFYTCNGCAVPYLPKRRPRTGENHYCVDCREQGIPARDRARAYRARKRIAGMTTSSQT